MLVELPDSDNWKSCTSYFLKLMKALLRDISYAIRFI